MTKGVTLTEMIETTISEILKGVGTTIPGHILSFDPLTQLAQVQVGIKRIDVDGESIEIAPISNVLVNFSGGDYSIEYEINPGNEGLIVISQRCIDAWREEGGIAGQPVLRKLDMQDALFIPGFRSKPNALSEFQNNGIRLRNKDGSQYFWLKNDGNMAGKIPGLFEMECTDFNVKSTTFTHNGVNVGATHPHLPGSYNIAGTPVTGNAGTPVP